MVPLVLTHRRFLLSNFTNGRQVSGSGPPVLNKIAQAAAKGLLRPSHGLLLDSLDGLGLFCLWLPQSYVLRILSLDMSEPRKVFWAFPAAFCWKGSSSCCLDGLMGSNRKSLLTLVERMLWNNQGSPDRDSSSFDAAGSSHVDTVETQSKPATTTLSRSASQSPGVSKPGLTAKAANIKQYHECKHGENILHPESLTPPNFSKPNAVDCYPWMPWELSVSRPDFLSPNIPSL